jgi:molybdopterin-guanine dinucleotide biosynthesis protein
MANEHPTIIAVSGFSSNVGKTTLVCELLQRLEGWEAIKLSRGHYRSCGKDPLACCVSNLLRDEAVVRSGREANYERGKDTGRFWEVGAANVHWVIVKDDQVEEGIDEALTRVQGPGVIIEGNSFLQHVDPDLAIMCARSEGGKVKPSARATLAKSDVIYISSLHQDSSHARHEFQQWCSNLPIDLSLDQLPIMTFEDIGKLIELIEVRAKVENSQVGKSGLASLTGTARVPACK